MDGEASVHLRFVLEQHQLFERGRLHILDQDSVRGLLHTFFPVFDRESALAHAEVVENLGLLEEVHGLGILNVLSAGLENGQTACTLQVRVIFVVILHLQKRFSNFFGFVDSRSCAQGGIHKIIGNLA